MSRRKIFETICMKKRKDLQKIGHFLRGSKLKMMTTAIKAPKKSSEKDQRYSSKNPN